MTKAKRRTREEWAQLFNDLSSLTSAEISRRIGVSYNNVCRARRMCRTPYRNGSLSRKRQWSGEELAMLGKLKDAEVAGRLGVTAATVKNKRQELGIASWRSLHHSFDDYESVRLYVKPDTLDVIDSLRGDFSRTRFVELLIAQLTESHDFMSVLKEAVASDGIRNVSKKSGVRANTIADWVAGRGRDGRKNPQRLTDLQVQAVAKAVGLTMVFLPTTLD